MNTKTEFTFGKLYKDINTSNTLKRFAMQVSPMQHFRELYVNAIEGGATRVEVTSDHDTYKRIGVSRLCVKDNGNGMTADELKLYIGNHNSSSKSKTSGVHDNFGIGAKATCLTWNKYGLVYLSYTKSGNSMVWLAYSEEANSYVMRTVPVLEWDDENNRPFTDDEGEPNYVESDSVIDLDLLEETYKDEGFEGVKWWNILPSGGSRYGTVVVLCGNHRKDNTAFHDADGNAITMREIRGYYTQRFSNLDKTLSVGFYRPHAIDLNASLSNKKSPASGLRQLLFASNYIPEHQMFNDWKVETFIGSSVALSRSEQGKLTDKQSVSFRKGMIFFEYRGEFYNIKGGYNVLKSFGINQKEVAKRTVLIITPPEFQENKETGSYSGAFPSETRDQLKFITGQYGQNELKDEFLTTTKELNYDDLKTAYDLNKPPMMARLLEEAFEKQVSQISSTSEDDLKKYASMFSTMRTTRKKEEEKRFVADSEGVNDFTPGELSAANGTPTNDKKQRETESNEKRGESSSGGSVANNPEVGKEGGEVKGREVNKRRNEPVIKVMWKRHAANDELDSDEFENFLYDDGVVYPFRYDHSEKGGILYGNKDHDIWKEISIFHRKGFRNAESEAVYKGIIEIVKDTYISSARLSIMHIKNQRKADRKININERTTPQCLSFMTYGVSHLASKVEQRIIKELELKRKK